MFLAFLYILIALLWLYIAWKAMRAHESIADSLKRYVDAELAPEVRSFSAERVENKRHYKDFLRDQPGASELPAKERHEKFRAWSEARGLDS